MDKWRITIPNGKAAEEFRKQWEALSVKEKCGFDLHLVQTCPPVVVATMGRLKPAQKVIDQQERINHWLREYFKHL